MPASEPKTPPPPTGTASEATPEPSSFRIVPAFVTVAVDPDARTMFEVAPRSLPSRIEPESFARVEESVIVRGPSR